MIEIQKPVLTFTGSQHASGLSLLREAGHCAIKHRPIQCVHRPWSWSLRYAHFTHLHISQNGLHKYSKCLMPHIYVPKYIVTCFTWVFISIWFIFIMNRLAVYYAHVLFYVLQNCFIQNVFLIEMCDDNSFINDSI